MAWLNRVPVLGQASPETVSEGNVLDMSVIMLTPMVCNIFHVQRPKQPTIEPKNPLTKACLFILFCNPN